MRQGEGAGTGGGGGLRVTVGKSLRMRNRKEFKEGFFEGEGGESGAPPVCHATFKAPMCPDGAQFPQHRRPLSSQRAKDHLRPLQDASSLHLGRVCLARLELGRLSDRWFHAGLALRRPPRPSLPSLCPSARFALVPLRSVPHVIVTVQSATDE